MSFFRPHKSKPRQFNYIPRHYDPVKEERNMRRRELHGTSTESDAEEYVPGRYIRTQREARDAAREERSRSSFKKTRNFVIVAVIVGLAVMYLIPRFVKLATLAAEEKQEQESERKKAEFIEELEDMEGIENPKAFMSLKEEMEAWQRETGDITIIPD
jgi:hypothetical protein